MKLMVISTHFWFKVLHGMNNDKKIIINTITLIHGKATNTTQDQIEFER